MATNNPGQNQSLNMTQLQVENCNQVTANNASHEHAQRMDMQAFLSNQSLQSMQSMMACQQQQLQYQIQYNQQQMMPIHVFQPLVKIPDQSIATDYCQADQQAIRVQSMDVYQNGQQPIQAQADTMWTYQTSPNMVVSPPQNVSAPEIQCSRQIFLGSNDMNWNFQPNTMPVSSLTTSDSSSKFMQKVPHSVGEMRTVTSQGMLLPLVQLPETQMTSNQNNPKEQMQDCMNTINEALRDPTFADAGKVLFQAMQASSNYMNDPGKQNQDGAQDKRFFLNASIQPREGNVVFPELPTFQSAPNEIMVSPTQQESKQEPHIVPVKVTPVLSSTPPPSARTDTAAIAPKAKATMHKASCGRVQKKPKAPSTIVEGSPHKFLLAMLRERGYSTQRLTSQEAGYHADPTPLQLASFGSLVVQAVHTNDTESLSKLLDCGLSPNPCNQFGDAILSLICKRAAHDVFKVFVDHGCDLQVCDSFGRTALHNLAWSGQFSATMAKVILDCDLNQLLIEDNRGQCPLEYVRRGHWDDWIAFLKDNVDTYWPLSMDRPRRSLPRYSRQYNDAGRAIIADPMSAVPPSLAARIASGEISTEEAMRMTSRSVPARASIDFSLF